MAPYIGLLDHWNRELSEPGYHRLDLSDVVFKVSPPARNLRHLTFVNAAAIYWPPARGSWSERPFSIAVFEEADSSRYLYRIPLRSAQPVLGPGDRITMAPGQLRVDVALDHLEGIEVAR